MTGNTNRQVKRRPPRDIDVLTVTDHAIDGLWDLLNATPRKCLGWCTPAEGFQDEIIEPGRRDQPSA